MTQKYNSKECRAILCNSTEEAIQLHAFAMLHGMEAGTVNNIFICNTTDVERIKDMFDVKHIVDVNEIIKWSDEGAKQWRTE